VHSVYRKSNDKQQIPPAHHYPNGIGLFTVRFLALKPRRKNV